MSLQWTGLLADDLYLMAHHDVSGKPRLPARVMGIGLAGALLGELGLEGVIDVRAGVLVAVNDIPLGDALAQTVFDRLLYEKQSVRTWLALLGQSAADDVANRLIQAGVLARQRSRVPWADERWVPVNVNQGALPVALLCAKIARGEQLDERSALLASLARAAGLDLLRRQVRAQAPHALKHLDDARTTLSPFLRHLVDKTDAAVVSAVASVRR